MIAKKGSIKRHHYAHVKVSDCTPEAVAQAIAGKWLVLNLGTLMALGQPFLIHWPENGHRQQVNLLEDVTQIVEHLPTNYGEADIALVSADGTIRAVLVLGLDHTTDTETLAKFAGNGITIIVLPTDSFRSGQTNIHTLFETAQLHGEWWLLDRPDDLPTLEVDPDIIRQALRNAASQPPFRFWGPLLNMGIRQDVLRVYDKLLWLPENMWLLTIGGSHHKLSEDLDILLQEWPQDDGSTIVLYYVRLKQDRAVAVRWFRAGERTHASLSANFRAFRASAEQVAYYLANN
jgi:hypothetical protein